MKTLLRWLPIIVISALGSVALGSVALLIGYTISTNFPPERLLSSAQLCPGMDECNWEGVVWYYDNSNQLRGFGVRQIVDNTPFKHKERTPWGKCNEVSPYSPGGYCLISWGFTDLGDEVLRSLTYPENLPSNLP